MDLATVANAADPMRILIVEDNPDDRAMYRRLLGRGDGSLFEIFEADSISHGLALSETAKPDCILLDYHLPDGDGLSFLRNYHGMPRHDAAIIMVTGNGNTDIAVQAMKMGVQDYIPKDNMPREFFTRIIASAVERSQMRAEAERRRNALEKSYKSLSDFTHTVSHDLKAPLRHIISYCDLLAEEYGQKLDEEGRRYTDRLGINARRLQRLIDDLLTYSSVTNAGEEKRDVDMNALVADIIEDLSEQIRGEKAHVDVGKLPTMRCYPVRMRQLMQNLIGNALKYRSSRVLIIDVSAEDKGDFWQVCVRDNGAGVPKEYQLSIFEAFKRLHAKDVIEGTGLGLSICRKVVEMHGGKIWVESETNEGSAFIFTIAKK